MFEVCGTTEMKEDIAILILKKADDWVVSYGEESDGGPVLLLCWSRF